jgi:uncharacterized protein (DUF1810 family)
MSDPFELQRFLDAQAPVMDDVLGELRRGRKESHWMWFVFPQIQGLGGSPMARRYAIASREEARAYLAHPLLGARLRECTRLALAHAGLGASEVFGYPDDLKLRSCLTLFAAAAPEEEVFAEGLRAFFGGAPDQATLARL